MTLLNFRRFGRSLHPVIDGPDALAAVPDLDEALWIATAAPTITLECDPGLITALDADGDGRIRSDEVRAAIRWLLANLTDKSGIRDDNTTLALDALDASTEDGRRMRAAADRALVLLGRPGDRTLTLDDLRGVRKKEEERGLSKAGCVLCSAAENELAAFLDHVVATVGPEDHPTRNPAVSDAKVTEFLARACSFLAWSDRESLETMPLREQTAAASALANSLDAKLDQYFQLCDAVRLDPRLAERAWPDPNGTDLLDPVAAGALMLRAPLARPRPDGVLALGDDVNPAYAETIARARAEVIVPLLQTDGATLTRAGWATIRERLAAHRAWIAERPDFRTDAPIDVIRRHAGDVGLVAAARALIAKSDAVAAGYDGIVLVEKLIVLQAHILRFSNSFVSQPDLYDADRHAMFEMGTLILDGRRLTLAVRVTDPVRHERFASAGAMFVIYAMIGEKNGTWDYEVAVPVTAGERGNITEGAWGVFIDLKGRERHAQVRKLVVNPISLREALVTPIWRFGTAVQGLIDKAGDAQQAALVSAAVPPAALAAGAPPPPAAPGATTQVATMAAGGGIALAAMGSLIAYVSALFWGSVTTLSGGMADLITPLITLRDGPPPQWVETVVQTASLPAAILLVILGFFAVPVLAYVVPVGIAAWLKLRRRDLAALLEGSGWAINRRMYVTTALAGVFTQTPKVPHSQIVGAAPLGRIVEIAR